MGGEEGRDISLLLGATGSLNRVLQVRPTRARRELGNMLITAPTRGGKGLLAVSQLLTWRGSAVVNDIKGDLFEQTAGYRATLGSVFVIDPRGRGHRYDPLTCRKTEDALHSSATQLLYDPNEGEGAVFTNRAIRMLTQIFKAARLEGANPIPYAAEMINSGLHDAVIRLQAVSLKAQLHPDQNLATKFLDSKFEEADFSDRFLRSAWSTLTSKLYPIITETVIRSVSASDFTPSDLMCADKPVTVYLRWPELHLLALTPLIRLVWSSIIDELSNTYDTMKDKSQCRPVLMLIDEATRTPIPGLPEYTTTVAGRGITLWIAIQSLSQLDAVYGTKRAETLRDNTDNQIFYRPANLGTANHLEERLGQYSAWAHSQTTHAGTQTSEGQQERSIPLLTAWQIQRMADEDIIGFHRALPPFRAKRMDWRNFPHLIRRTKLQPPQLPYLAGLPSLLSESVRDITLPEIIDADEFN